VIDRLLLERTVDIINQVVQARLLRLTSEKRRISKWVWGLLILLAMSSFYGVLLIQGGSMILNLAFCGITIVVMTSAFVILTDMEQPFSGFVQVDTSMFLLIRRDVRIVLRSAHMDQLQAIERERNGRRALTDSQLAALEQHKRESVGSHSVSRVDVSKTIASAEQRLTAAEPAPHHRRLSITDLIKSKSMSALPVPVGSGSEGSSMDFRPQFVTPTELENLSKSRSAVEVGDGERLASSVVERMKQRRSGAEIPVSPLQTPASPSQERRPSLDISSFGKSPRSSRNLGGAPHARP
jgi:hypothetical protein